MTNLVPVEDHILVEAIEDEAITKSGFILPESNKEKPTRGKVLAVGKGKMLDTGARSPMDIEVGMIVHFKSYSPQELKGEKSEPKKMIIRYNDVYGYEE